MENNNLSLAELKAQAQATSVGGEKIEPNAGTTIGGDWMANTVSETIAPEPVVVVSPPQESVLADIVHTPVVIPVTDIPQLPPEEYTGPGLVINPADLIEKPVVMAAPGAPVGLDETLNKYLNEYDERIEVAKVIYEEKTKDVPKAPEEEPTDDDPEEFNKKYQDAIVVIDKTGMGTTIEFTDAERQKLDHAKKITVQEVETTTLKVLKTKKAVSGKNSFKIDTIIERKQSLHSTNIVLPASGYTATMRGCTPYELMEIINENKNEVINQEIRWGLIYRKLESTSIGKMTFNQFLERTASIDYQVFLFGILCATYPDDDKFPLTCQTEGCGKQFEHHYSVKSLIRAEKMTELSKEKFAQIVDAGHTVEGAIKLHSEFPVMQVKRIVLPYSKYILDISIQSGYDSIYKSIKELNKDKREEKYQQAAITSSIVRKLYIPDGEGEDPEYFEFDQPFDITKAVYSLDAIDLKILYKQAELLFADTSFEFGLMNVCCPYCRTITNTVAVDVENVLFYKYHQELSTTVG